MPHMMQPSVVEAFAQPIANPEFAIAIADPGQMLIKTAVGGLCHTDLHAAREDRLAKLIAPLIAGHEDIRIAVRSSSVGTRKDLTEPLAGAPISTVKAELDLHPASAIAVVSEELDHRQKPLRIILGLGNSHERN
jgi:D-arabinose 1-dehydrogenase-like Zn-dependent alcohol dehydrogenase